MLYLLDMSFSFLKIHDVFACSLCTSRYLILNERKTSRRTEKMNSIQNRSNTLDCIDDYFSDELLGKILRCCPADSYETLRSVSKRWDKVVDSYVGRVLVVKSGNTFMVDPDSNMDRMSIRTNYWMTLSSLTENSKTEKDLTEGETDADENVVEVEKLQDISNPDSVRKIGFVGQLGLGGYKPIECILSPCKNITSLYLHLSLFCVPKQNDTTEGNEPWMVSCSLPTLKEMVIDSCGMSHEDSTNLFNFKSTLLNLAYFLCSQKFTCLKKAVFAIPYMESTEGIIVRSLCIFLGKHAQTITSFSFTQKYEIYDDDAEDENDSSSESENEQENKTEISHQHKGDGDRKGNTIFNFSTDVDYLTLSQLALSAKELKNVILEELHVLLIKRQESAPVWKNLLIKQDRMKRCIFTGDKIPIPTGAIEMSSPNLVTLRLDIRDGVNLECFQACVHLKHLSLGGKNDVNESNDDEGNETASFSGSAMYQRPLQLINAKCLPVGLESLEIINLRTHKDDARILALELPSLCDLTLKNLGWEGNLGLRLSDLAKIYEIRSLDHLCIKASLNLISFSELEEETCSPELNLFACVVQSNSFAAASRCFLEVWKREKDGLYSTRKSASNINWEEEELDVFQAPNKVELREEEEQESSSSDSDSEEEDDDDKAEETEDGEENDDTDVDAVTDDEWQECEDEEGEGGEVTEVKDN